ncbi:MAG: DUF1501 domain-containing protein [Planctomycetota bacterium]|nr:DUF1501 domain-containing protein [Planctomycetota bacterium]
MFTFLGQGRRFCDLGTRRDFLRIGGLGVGAGSLGLSDLLKARAVGPNAKNASKAKSAIFVYLPGGPSHIDMWDPKPDAPAEIRGEFKGTETNIPGIRINELFTRQAAMFQHFAAVRGVVSVNEHSDSLVMTGYSDIENRIMNHPSFGSVLSKLRGMNDDGIPPFVSLRGASKGTEPGYLGVAHRPFTPEGQGVANLRPTPANAGERLTKRRDLLNQFDDFRKESDTTGTANGIDQFTSRAFEIVSSGTVRKALDLSKEEAKVRESYRGVENFLTARRLIEAGVGCLTLSYGGWDTHVNNFVQLKRQLPILDRAIGNLVTDLKERGMLDEVAIVVWGEFGRTPKINGTAGRDHWPTAMNALVAGGGLRTGQVVGGTNSNAEKPKDRGYPVQRVLSTVYHALGIDPGMTFLDTFGRPQHLLSDREPITELLG